jgi:hypothetical protein
MTNDPEKKEPMSSEIFHSAKHPFWGIARLFIFMLALVCVLYLNASHFDVTEIKTIITMFIIAAGAEGVTGFLSQLKGNY